MHDPKAQNTSSQELMNIASGSSSRSLTPNSPVSPENAKLNERLKYSSHLKLNERIGLQEISRFALKDEIVMALWVTMEMTYGRKWSENFGDSMGADGKITPTMRFWAQALADFTPEQIQAGIEKCCKRETPFIPNLPEFVQLCKPVRKYGPGRVL